MRITVDPAACDGFGYCVEMLPELMSVDEWGFPGRGANADVPAGLLDAARQAARACPRRALLRAPEEPKAAEPPGPARSQAEGGAARRPLGPASVGFQALCGRVLHPVRLLVGQPRVAEVRPR